MTERRNRDEVNESELKERQQLAMKIMEQQNPPIRPDPVTAGKRRCTTCYKLLDFKFVVDGEALPHCQLNKAAPGGTVRKFCPIVDDPTLFYESVDRKKQKKAQENQRAYIRKSNTHKQLVLPLLFSLFLSFLSLLSFSLSFLLFLSLFFSPLGAFLFPRTALGGVAGPCT